MKRKLRPQPGLFDALAYPRTAPTEIEERHAQAKRWLGVSTSTFGWLLLTALMLPLLFPPFYCFFFAPIALVPFGFCLIRRPLSFGYFFSYFLLGIAFYIPNLFWLAPVTVGGYLALAAFVALYFPLFAFVLHRLVNQLRLPATLAFPIAWTAVEYVRCTFIQGGFPWFPLGNCFAPAAILIQTADIFGVWGITFLIALMNGFFVDLLRLPLFEQKRLNPKLATLFGITFATVALSLLYGYFRLNQNTITLGPRIAVIQENIPQQVKDSGRAEIDILDRHIALTREAAHQSPSPDLIVWPETMVPGFGNAEFLNAPNSAFATFGTGADAWPNPDYRDQCRYVINGLHELSQALHTPLLLGIGGFTPITDLNDSIKQNLTLLMTPDHGVVDSYAKIHLVPFGEYLPFRSLPLVGKYMVNLSPYGYDFSNTPGNRWTRYVLAVSPDTTHPARTYTFGTPICFEDTMPDPCRQMTLAHRDRGIDYPKADFLVSVSNDGWFHWVQLDQHIQATQLRAVENRVPIARSVNTGDSGFIDSNGRIIEFVHDANGQTIHAIGTAAVNLPLDSRITLFSQTPGPLLPTFCGILDIVLVGWTLVRPRRAAS